MTIFWSEIGLGVLEPGDTPTPRIPRNTTRVFTFHDPQWESKQTKLQDVRSSMLDCYSALTKSPQLDKKKETPAYLYQESIFATSAIM